MPHSIVYNGKPIEELEKPELLLVIEALCRQLDDWKRSAEWFKEKYEQAVNVEPPP